MLRVFVTVDGGGDFKAINPNGYVPALALEDGTLLTCDAQGQELRRLSVASGAGLLMRLAGTAAHRRY